MKETEEHKFLRKIFGSIKIRKYATAFSVISLIFAVVGMSLALKLVFSIYAQKIAKEGLDLVQQAGLSQEMYQVFIDYANQVIRQMMLYIIGFVALTTLVLNAIFNWVSHRLIITPLERIGSKARQISKDRSQLGEQIEPPLIEEMQMLTEAFNQMSTSLRTQMDELEDRVQERTKDLEAAKEKMEHMAKYDALTGLPNRWLFDEQLKQALRLSDRDHTQLTLLMIDLDNYKEINDNYGHLVGDEVIKAVGERFAETLRDVPIIGPIYYELISGHTILVYVALAMVPLTWWVLYRTRFGLRLPCRWWRCALPLLASAACCAASRGPIWRPRCKPVSSRT